MLDIFVSYASRDRDRVRPLVERLQAEGWNVWWDRHIEGGADWEAEIEKALDQAACTLVIWSTASVASDWVRTEAGEALSRNCLVPVMLEDVALPLRFRRVQGRRLIGWPERHDGRELDQCIGDIRRLLSERQQAGTAPVVRERAERRQVTLLRGDLVATDGDVPDPELLDDVLAGFAPRLREALARMSGTLLALDHGGFTCVFGVPRALEDDELFAAESAFRLAELVPPGEGVGLRMGLATGVAVVTYEPGGALRLAGNLAASATALASRAGVGELLVSDAAERRLKPYFLTRSAGDGAASVLERTAVRDRIDAAKAVGLTPLVGRRAELLALEGALADAALGEGRAICLVGESGAGKGRLAHEFRLAIADSGAKVVQVHCQAHGRTRSHGPFADLLFELLELGEVPAEARQAEAIVRIRALHAGLEGHLPQLLFLLGLGDRHYPLPEALEGLALRRALDEAIVAAATASTAQQPLVLIVRDWHWADEASADTLRQLVAAAACHRMLLLVCARPESVPALPAAAHSSQIVLRPLNEHQVGELLRHVARADAVAPGLGALVHARTDGIPLFVEEMARTLLDDGWLSVTDGVLRPVRPIDTRDLPGSIEAVVRSRLDRLDTEVLDMVRMAAVFGREFERRFLDDLYGDAEAVGLWLSRAVAEGVVQQTRLLPEPHYRFRHLLTQLVAYESLLLKQRRQLHRRVGEWIEERHALDLDPQLERLAHHFQHADVREKAVAYLAQAGNSAAANASHSAAADMLRKAIALLDQMEPSAARDASLLEAHVALGNTLLLVEGYAAPEVTAVFDRARALGHAATPGPALFANLWLVWRYQYNAGQIADAEDTAARLRTLADGLEDSSLRMAARTAQGVILYMQGAVADGAAMLTEALRHWTPEAERPLALQLRLSPAVLAMSFLGLCQVRAGRLDAGMERFAMLRSLTAALNHPMSEVLALQYLYAAHLFLEDTGQARIDNDRLAALTAEHGLAHWQALARMNAAQLLLMGDNPVTGVQPFREAASEVDRMGVALLRDRQLLTFALMAHGLKQHQAALGLLDEAQAYMDTHGARHLEMDMVRIRLVVEADQDTAAAVARALPMLDTLGARGDGLNRLRLSAAIAPYLNALGRGREALALLEVAMASVHPGHHGGLPLFCRIQALMAGLRQAADAA